MPLISALCRQGDLGVGGQPGLQTECRDSKDNTEKNQKEEEEAKEEEESLEGRVRACTGSSRR